MLSKRTLLVAIAAILVSAACAGEGYAAASPTTCLAVVNNRAATVSVVVDGFTPGYWVAEPGDDFVLTIDDKPIRAASFTIYIYAGSDGDKGAQIEGSNRYVRWVYETGNFGGGKCRAAWVAYLHD